MTTKTCSIFEILQDRTKITMTDNRKLHTRFRLVPKSMTLDDLEWPKRTLAEKNCFTQPTRKKSE